MIHYFNPGHETAVLNKSKYYMAPANVIAMQKELSFLSAWHASPSDYILIENKLPDDFKAFIQANLGDIPQGVTKQYISENQEIFRGQGIALWGQSPQAIHFFEAISNEAGLDLLLPQWDDSYVALCSRQTAQQCLHFISGQSDKIVQDIIPNFYTSLDDIENAVKSSNEQLLAKAPYSSSGRGLLWLPVKVLTRTERQILHGHLKKQGSVSLERVLDKQLDFAMEFTSQSGKVEYHGLSLFETNQKGAYIGNILGSQIIIEETITSFINITLIDEIRALLIQFIKQDIAPVYDGCIGVDMMVYKEHNEYKFHPCLEINIRNNMGFIALNLSKNILAENSIGNFYIDFDPKDGSMQEKHNRMKNEYPAIFEDKRLKSGYLSLCPVTESNHYRAYILMQN